MIGARGDKCTIKVTTYVYKAMADSVEDMRLCDSIVVCGIYSLMYLVVH